MPTATTRRRGHQPLVAAIVIAASCVAIAPTALASAPDEPADSTDPADRDVAADASFAELVAIAADALGPTRDLSATIVALTTTAAQIRTPANASLEAFEIDHDTSLRASFLVGTTATADDLTVFYRATMAATGAELLDERSSNGGAGRELTFAAPDLDDDGRIVVTVLPGDVRGAAAEIVIVDQPADRDAVASFAAPLTPLAADGTAAGAGLSARLDGTEDDRAAITVTVTARFEFEATTPAELRAAWLADVPVAGFTRSGNGDDDNDGRVTLGHPYLSDVTATFADTPDGALLTLNATANVEL